MNFAASLLGQSVLILGAAVAMAALFKRPDVRVGVLRYAFLGVVAIAAVRLIVPGISNPMLAAHKSSPSAAMPSVLSHPLTKSGVSNSALLNVRYAQVKPTVHPALKAAIEEASQPNLPTFNPAQTLFGVWVIGAVVLLGRVALGLIWLRGLRRGSKSFDYSPLSDRIAILSSRYGVAGVEIAQSPFIKTPLVAGFWRTTVFLPPCENGEFSDVEFDAMVGHEFGHVRARDCAWALASQVAVALIWPNPLAWLARRQMAIASEELCDLTVLQFGTRADDYAECLLRIASRSSGYNPSSGAALGMFVSRGQLSRRVSRLLDASRMHYQRLGRRSYAQIASGAGAVALASCLIVPPTALAEKRPHASEPSKEFGSFPPSAHELSLAGKSDLPYLKGDFTLRYRLVIQDRRSDAQRKADFEADRNRLLTFVREFVQRGQITQAQADERVKQVGNLQPRPSPDSREILVSCRNGMLLYRDSEGKSMLIKRDHVYETFPNQGNVSELFYAINAMNMPLPAVGFSHFPLSTTVISASQSGDKIADVPYFPAAGPTLPFDGGLKTNMVRLPRIAVFKGQGKDRRLVGFNLKDGSPEYVFRRFTPLKGTQIASEYIRYWDHLECDYQVEEDKDSSLDAKEFEPGEFFKGKNVEISYKGRRVDFKADPNGSDLDAQVLRQVAKDEAQAEYLQRLDAHLATIPNGGPDILPIYTNALKKAKEDGKHVLAIATGTSCPPCRDLEKMLNDPVVQPIIDKHFVVLWIDAGEATDQGKKSENKNGEELCKKLGIWTGFPSYCAVDGEGRVLAVPGTLGFPANATDDARFFKILDAGNTPLSPDEKRTLQAYLNGTRRKV